MENKAATVLGAEWDNWRDHGDIGHGYASRQPQEGAGVSWQAWDLGCC